MTNCTGRDTSNNKQKCLGIEELKEFLEFQEVTPTEEELMQIVQVRGYSHQTNTGKKAKKIKQSNEIKR